MRRYWPRVPGPLPKVLQSLRSGCAGPFPRPGMAARSVRRLTSRPPRSTLLPARLARLGMAMRRVRGPGPRADLPATRSAWTATTARRAASCSDFFSRENSAFGSCGAAGGRARGGLLLGDWPPHWREARKGVGGAPSSVYPHSAQRATAPPSPARSAGRAQCATPPSGGSWAPPTLRVPQEP